MLDIAWKNMWTRKLRTILTILGIAIALELVILMTTIVDSTEQSMQSELTKYSGAGQIYVRSQTILGITGQEFPPINSILKEEEGRQIISEVTDQVNPRLTTPLLFYQLAQPPYPNAGPEALLVGIDADKLMAYIGENPVVGEGVPQFSTPTAREVILGPMARNYYGRPKVGDEIQVISEKFRVVSLLESNGPNDRLTSNVVLIPLKTAQSLLVRSDSISAVLITSMRLDNISGLAENIQANHPKTSVLTQKEIANNLDTILVQERFFFNIINYTVYIVAAVVVLIVMIMAVTERTKEIGTLRAIGASRGLVMRTILIEAVMLGLIGSLLSIPIAFLIDLGIGYGLRQVVSPVSLIQVVVTAVVLSAVAAAIPAYRSTKINPIEALRYE
jgi:putative ABC transport system permease protein